MKKIVLIVVVALFAALSAQSTLLDFSFEDNPSPQSPYDGDYYRGQQIASGGTNYYGSYINTTQSRAWTTHPVATWHDVLANYTTGGAGWTPDVTMGWSASQTFATWDSGFGDLIDVVYLNTDVVGGADFWVAATGSDPAKLHSFDMATFGVSNATIDIQVTDTTGTNVLWSVNNASLGDGTDHVTFVPNAVDETVRVYFSDLQGASWDEVGLDNILISQNISVVPPARGVLLDFNFESAPTNPPYSGDFFNGQEIKSGGSGYYGSFVTVSQSIAWTMYSGTWYSPYANYILGSEGCPDIQMGWSANQKFTTWDSGYGDLNNVVYLNTDVDNATQGADFWATIASGSDLAKLHSFDMATFGVSNATIDIKVTDAGGTTLWSVDDASLGDGTDHVTFAPNAVDETVRVYFSDLQGASWGEVGLDNILVSQQAPVVLATRAALLEFNLNDNPDPQSPYDGDYYRGQRIKSGSTAEYYGNNVTNAQSTTWTTHPDTTWHHVLATYTLGSEGCPDIQMGWSANQKFTTWDSGFGDLNNVVYLNTNVVGGADFWVAATGSDPAKLHSFDMATFGVSNATIDIQVTDTTGTNVLWSVNNASLGDGTDHVTFVPNAVDETVRVYFSDLQGASWGEVGLDNILISQNISVVPPARGALLEFNLNDNPNPQSPYDGDYYRGQRIKPGSTAEYYGNNVTNTQSTTWTTHPDTTWHHVLATYTLGSEGCPDITMGWSANQKFTTWDSGYGDLNNVVFLNTDVADTNADFWATTVVAGIDEAKLHSFDMATFGVPGVTMDIKVTDDATGTNVLWAMDNASLGDGTDHVTFTINVADETVRVFFSDLRQNGSVYTDWVNIAIDNVLISQQEALGKPATILSFSYLADNNVVRMVVDAPNAASGYHPVATTNLVDGVGWVDVMHSTNGVDGFVYTNLSYSASDATGTNEVIYLQVDTAAKFYKINGQ